MEVSSLKTRMNDKLNKVKEFHEKNLNELEQEDSGREINEILTKENKTFFFEKSAISNSVNNSFTPSSSSEAYTKLSKLKLPKFKGNIIKWRDFWNQYKAAIHDIENLSVVEKFTYPKSFLADSALATISGLNLNAESYKEATDIFEKRWSSVQEMLSAFITNFAQLPKIRSSNHIYD